jgi:hypothetical protein
MRRLLTTIGLLAVMAIGLQTAMADDPTPSPTPFPDPCSYVTLQDPYETGNVDIWGNPEIITQECHSQNNGGYTTYSVSNMFRLEQFAPYGIDPNQLDDHQFHYDTEIFNDLLSDLYAVPPIQTVNGVTANGAGAATLQGTTTGVRVGREQLTLGLSQTTIDLDHMVPASWREGVRCSTSGLDRFYNATPGALEFKVIDSGDHSQVVWGAAPGAVPMVCTYLY